MFGSVRCVVALASTLVVAGALSARAEPRGADDGTVLVDAIVASVDGAPITLVDLEQYERGAGQLLPPSERESRSSMLDALVLSKLFQAEFDKKGIRASDSDVDIYIDNVVRESGTSRDEIKRSLAEIGLTWDQYFERARQELQRMALLNREIRARVNVTPEEVERTWREDPQYSTPERMEIGHIYIPVGSSPDAHSAARARADEAQQAARKNFGKAAKNYSEGPHADEGGILGVFTAAEMASSFAQAVAGLDAGDVSAPFEADGAFHILKVARVVPAEPKPLEDVRKDIEDRLYAENLDTRFRRWIDEDLRKRHHVTVQYRDLDSLLEASRS